MRGRGGRLAARRQLGPLADLGEGDAAEALLGDLVEDDRRVGRELDLEALGELREPREHVRHRREDGAALALQPALEVDRRAVALQVARAREDEVGEAAEALLEHADPDHDLGLGGERAHGRVGRRLVAGDDEHARLLVDRLAVAGGAPGVGDAAAVRRARQVVDVRRARRAASVAASSVTSASTGPSGAP